MNRVAERLKELEREIQGFRLETLKENELFLTVVLHATTTALRSHQEEKLRALQNAIVNCARKISIQENLQLLFLNAVDDLTPLHLQILKYFQNPPQWLNEHEIKFRPSMGGAGSGLEAAFPGLRREIYDPIVMDLFNRGLVNADKTVLHAMMGESGILSSRITELGTQFLKYIEA